MKPINSLGYSIYFEDDLSSLGKFISQSTYSKILVLVDRNTAEECLPYFQSCLPDLGDYDVIEIDPGEENKNIDFCIGVWKTMLDFGADRKSLMINLGGGVVTDMGGFAASTFMRGIDFVQVPTTLLAQVDASVGGKTGIDLDDVKNMVGTFAQPKGVFISTSFLKTLDQRQVISGFAEMLKHGLIQDRNYFGTLTTAPLAEVISEESIYHSVKIKNEVVLQDPEESGPRKMLNFGHTIGHAVETWYLQHQEQAILHGEAIAVGMLCEGYLSYRRAGLSIEELDSITTIINSIFPPIAVPESADSTLLGYMKNDKKNQQDQIGFALLSAIGQCEYNHFVSEELIVESLAFYRQLIAKS